MVRIKPDPLQQLPCPQQMIEFRCSISVPSLAIKWILPTGASVQTDNIGGGGSIDTYSVSVTNKTEDPNSASRFFFTSTLLVMEPVNGSNVTCVGLSGADPVKESTSIILSGKNCCNRFLPTYNFA